MKGARHIEPDFRIYYIEQVGEGTEVLMNLVEPIGTRWHLVMLRPVDTSATQNNGYSLTTR